MLRRPLILVVCLLASLVLVDTASAQRRSSGESTSRSSGGSVSRSSGGSSGGSVSRPSSSSRPSVSRPSSSSSSRSSVSGSSSSSSNRSSSAPTRSSSSYSAPTTTRTTTRSYDTSRNSSTNTDSRAITRQPTTTSTTIPDSSTRSTDGWRANTTSTPRSQPTNTRDLSRPLSSGSGVIDLTDAGVQPRVRFPLAADNFRGVETPIAPGSRRILSQELRSRVSTEDLARMQRTAGSATPVVRSGAVDRDDILNRYRGSGAVSSSSQADPRTLRRAAAQADGLSSGRRGSAGQADARAASARLQEQRAMEARSDKNSLDAQRAQDSRAASRAERVQKARQNYIDSVANAGGAGNSGSGSGGGDGYGDGYDDGYDDGYHDSHHHHHYWNLCWNHYGHYWGHGYWGWNWCGPSWAWSFWWHSYWYRGGYYSSGYCPPFYYYGPFVPTVVIQVGNTSGADVIYVEDDEPEIVYVDGSAPAGEATVAPQQGEPLNRASDYYLTLGDRAFRDGRYADAVHYYAKAVEFSPEDGILYLILSDALFATGDYHYAAYAMRKAFELDPALATNVIDKHSFYADPAEFDRQLEVLEGYLNDHFLDDDARLVLAANYLFGGRPGAAAELLESAFSLEVKRSPAGLKILEAATAIGQGAPVPSASPEGAAN